MNNLLLIVVGSVLVNNFVMSQFLGICPFLGVSKKSETALGMGLAVTFVICYRPLLSPYSSPEKPWKARDIRPAMISAPEKPSIHLGILLRASRSRMLAKMTIASVKPIAALKPLTTDSIRL